MFLFREEPTPEGAVGEMGLLKMEPALEFYKQKTNQGEHEASLQILQSLHGKRIGIPRKNPRNLASTTGR